MAVETVAELYYQLGLDTAKLESGFIDAQKTVNQNMRIMNHQEALIKLRADVQIQGLDENVEMTDALKIRQEELAQRLEVTRDKVDLTSAAYEQMTQSQGENSAAAQALAIQLEKERLVMAQLERQTRELNEQQKIAVGVQWEFWGLIEPAVKGIKGLYEAGHTLGSLSQIQVQVGAAIAMVVAAIATGTKMASDELEEENLAKLLDSEFAQAQINISNSLDTINQKTLQTSNQMKQSFQNVQRELTGKEYISDFLRLVSIAAQDTDSLSEELSRITQNTQFMNTEFGKTIALAVGVGKTFSALKESSKQWVKTALEGFRDLNKKAQEMKVPLPVASDIVNLINLAGGDYDDVRDYVRGVQDAIIKGTADDPEALALEKTGVTIQDARGNLLSFNEALENLYQGFLKAKEAGEEEAFIIMTNGQSVHDVLPFFENYAKAKQKFNDIQWSTSDYASLSGLSSNIKLAEIQAEEFKTAVSSLAIPLANYSAESDFSFFKTLTQLVEENRDTILYWEFVFIEALKSVEDFATEELDAIINKLKELDETFGITDKLKNIFSDSNAVPENFKKMQDDLESLKSPAVELTNTIDSIIEGLTGFNDWFGILDEDSLSKVVENFNSFKSAAEDTANTFEYFSLNDWFGDSEKLDSTSSGILQKAQEDLDSYIAANEKARAETEKTAKEITDGLSYSLNRIAKYKEEIEALKIDLQFGDDEYRKSLAQLEQWRETALRDARQYEAEQAVIAEEYALKRELIEKQHFEEIARVREESLKRAEELFKETADIEFSQTHSALEQQLRDIEQWKQAQLEKASTAEEVAATISNAAMKEADAFEREVDRMRGKIESAQDRLARLTLSQRDNDIYQAQKQYYQDLKELPKEFADAIYNVQIATIREREKKDKTGSYTKRQNTTQNSDTYYKLLDFTKNGKRIKPNTDRLIKLDAEKEAYNEVLKKARAGIEEVDRSVNKAKIPLMGLTGELSKAESATEKTMQQLQGTADTAKELGGTLGSADTAISKNANAMENATSAAGTFAAALDKNAQIRAQNSEQSLQLPRLEKRPTLDGIKVLFGDDPIYAKNRIQNGVKFLYGDDLSKPINLDEAEDEEIPALYSKFANAGDATEKLTAAINSANVDSLENVNDAAEKVIQNLEQVGNIDLQKSLTDFQTAFSPLIEKLTAFEIALNSLTDSFQQAADKINAIDFKAPQMPTMPAEKQNTGVDIADTALDVTQTSGKIASLIGTVMSAAPLFAPAWIGAAQLAMKGVQLALVGSGTEIFADIAQQARNFHNANETATSTNTNAFSSDNTVFNQMTQPLVSLTQTAGSIAQNVSAIQQQSQQPKQIIVSPNISIDLGGAYVFDDSMKQKLTDDITSEVANAITAAVSTATSKANYSFSA